MELESLDINDIPSQSISLDCNFWQGFDLFMNLPTVMSSFTPEMENDNFDLYLLDR